MTEIAAGIDVPATPATVWEVLTDVSAYRRWNTLLSVRGEFAVGETVDARLSVPGLPTVSFAPEITVVDPRRELSWRSTLFGVDAEHRFPLEPTAGGCRFVQRETVDGPLAARLADRFDRRLVRGFEQMNVGLRRRATELQ
ncbi:SRPBCC domain-containing protein [Halomicroarcula limicola]|uniref:SRPBCC domain-containing protein n=1 Tax=Haloarcula limicola TaxID=1429915 RepID=A0A8J7YAA0_9EURY|nr:SRPBCC domain-containing protein [Halomicroarcula limicola]MBV0922823.1 SRPBCC domain-containing protein [Halomicroarcula limicola]